MTATWDQVSGSWKQFKGKIREKWGRLSDDELDVIAGKREQLAGKLQRHYGYVKDDAERHIDDFLNDCDTDDCENSCSMDSGSKKPAHENQSRRA